MKCGKTWKPTKPFGELNEIQPPKAELLRARDVPFERKSVKVLGEMKCGKTWKPTKPFGDLKVTRPWYPANKASMSRVWTSDTGTW